MAEQEIEQRLLCLICKFAVCITPFAVILIIASVLSLIHICVPDEVIITALRRAGVSGQAPRTGRAITYADLYELGLSGTQGAAGARRRVLQRAGLPPRLSKKALCAALSSLYTYEEFRALSLIHI